MQEVSAMSPSTLEMTIDLVLTQIQTGNITPEEVPNAIRRIYQSLLTLKSREELELPISASAADTPQAPADWRKSIARHSITCLECGAHLRQLTGRHLRLHGLDARTYRRKYGIPQNQPLFARATLARQRAMLKRTRPWEKSPMYVKAQEAKAATAKKSGRKKGTRKR
jgi:predicted transcriptional regulator